VKPTSSLWELSGRAVRKLRDLTGERYLAGTLDGRRVWNVFDSTLGDWRLTAETASGPIDLGCGRTMVDPRAEPDPDRGPIAPSPASTPAPTASTTPTDSPTATATPAATTTASPSPTIAPIVGPTEGILVGDLGSPEAADAVAAAIEAAYGGRTDVEVVDNASAPWLIQPGAWAAVMRLSPDQDPVASWLSFRDRLPQFAGMCWVVAL
jgi:hypothetical protein